MRPYRTAGLCLALFALGQRATAQSGPTAARGWMGGSVGAILIDGGGFSGLEPRPVVQVHAGGFQPRRLSVEAAGMMVPLDVLGASLAIGAHVGATYRFGEGRFSLSLGPAALIPLGGGDSDFLPGGQLAVTWIPASMRPDGRWLFVQYRQHGYVRDGELLRYPSLLAGAALGLR